MVARPDSTEKLFAGDVLSKRERVERTLNHRPVDRVALLEQLSYNPAVIAACTGKQIQGFDYTVEDVGVAVRQTMDMCMPVVAPRGTAQETAEDGFVHQNDEWTSWIVSRPFDDVPGARDWLRQSIAALEAREFDAAAAKEQYREYMQRQQSLVGETVIMAYSSTGICAIWSRMGLPIFSFFYHDYPGLLTEYLEVSTALEVKRIHAVADRAVSPLVLVPEDVCSKTGPLFSPAFMEKYHYSYLSRLAEAWHSHGITVLYHTDGSFRQLVPDLIACGFEGFYCLEPNAGMEIDELKHSWPDIVWAGGVDGVDLMERGTPQQVRAEVQRHIRETNALQSGGMFVASSSEINPPIKPESFQAMVAAVGELRNDDFVA